MNGTKNGLKPTHLEGRQKVDTVGLFGSYLVYNATIAGAEGTFGLVTAG